MRLQTTRGRLLASTMICGTALAAFATAAPALAQESTEVEAVVVTGSRIARQDYVANSPIATVTGEQVVANADVTLDTYLNTLPQVNPAGTTTSNNPGNGGQSNVDLRGFGSNRNIVLVDGRRPMVSANTLTVDLNTIPQALIDSIEVITGGAGATYGADAIAGAVNLKLKKNFEGIDVRASYQNSTEYWDAEEYQFSLVLGGNFADGKGNAVIAFDRSSREGMIKSQRPFSQNATSTTSFNPDGMIRWSGTNAPTEAAVDGVFAGYGVGANSVRAQSGTLGVNVDGSLFFTGIYNNTQYNAQNYRGAIDGTVNQNLYPDLYVYNFDFVNILTLPMDRYSFLSKLNYELDNGVEFFSQVGWTEYNSTTALAPTPFPTVNTRNACDASASNVVSSLVNCGRQVSQEIVVPVTNPFIPADLLTILNSRTGDDVALAGSGATEPFKMRQRTLDLGLRQSVYENTVVQFMAGVRAPLGDSGWELEAYVSEGRTEIDQTQTGNLNTQRLQGMLEAGDGGVSQCAGGFNIFGRQPISAACRAYLEVATTLSTEMVQQIAQAYVTGPVYELPAGTASVVFGAEFRGFDYSFDPGAASGPISGFNTQSADSGTNSFSDIFAEALIPLVKDAPFAQSIDLSLGYRYSWSEFEDRITGDSRASRGSPSYKIELNWAVVDELRFRASYQRSVREPNFGELFASGGSAPQYFDPCSVGTAARTGPDAAQVKALCLLPGNFLGVSASAIDTYVQLPGSQIGVDVSGNTALDPEQGKTFTIGMAWSSPFESQWLSRLRGTVDYWNIKIDEAILVPTPNQITAACFNYYGTNPTYTNGTTACQGILRTGGDILWIYNPSSADGSFEANNDGYQKASGIDFQVDYGFDMEWLGLDNWGSIRLNALLSYLIEFKQKDPFDGSVELDFAGSASYFGSGLGTSYPEWKATINAAWTVGDFTFATRGRYIGEMANRLAIEFPGEKFTSPDSTWYWDVSGQWDMTDNVAFKLGVNNIADQEPQTYNPNVQSGTDPSVYDVVGRRVFGQIKLRF
ncbi:MAG: TonB-dependent receptor [Caulobacter sp.]|nr:TonB-dependent receptor [Caulobacter sp.]